MKKFTINRKIRQAGDACKPVIEKVNAGFCDGVSFLKNGIDGVSEKVKGGFDGVSEKVKGGFGNVSEKVKGGFDGVSAKFRRRYMALKEGNAEMRGKLLAYFNRRMEWYKEHYDSEKLFKKIGEVAKIAGSNVVYIVLVLYYSLLGKDVSLKDRAMVIAALGYFISPVDFIPDLLGVIGFADDFGVLMFVFKKIRDNVSAEVLQKAKHRLTEWFGEESAAKVKV